MSEPVIATRALTKRFGPVLAVDAIDLDVRAGDVYGFLGANGSGKTTTVRMLLGLVLATSGEAEVLGGRMPRSAKAVLPQVGTLVEGPAAYLHLSRAREPRALRRDGLRRVAAARPGWTTCSSASGSASRGTAGCAATPWACGSGSGSPPRCCGHRGCWCSTSPPTAWTRRASARCGTCCWR